MIECLVKTFSCFPSHLMCWCHNHLRHTGEEVKDKNENLLTRARTREDKMEEKFKWQPLAPPDHKL